MPLEDWHAEDIKASIRKRGTTLTSLAIRSGYSECACRYALRHAWPEVEAIIASFLNTTPQTIWPSRYDANGEPRRGLRSKRENTAVRRRRHRQK